jgi:hypothetical protein
MIIDIQTNVGQSHTHTIVNVIVVALVVLIKLILHR